MAPSEGDIVRTTTLRLCALVTLIALTSGTLLWAEGVESNVVAIDQKKEQLSLDWMNDTTKVIHWNHDTKFSVLETGAASKPTAIRIGSYLRIKGEEQNGAFVATEIVIWLEQSKPAPPK
jgi:hypothetical protein